MLHQNRRVLEKIVEELLEFEILTAKVKGYVHFDLYLFKTLFHPILYMYIDRLVLRFLETTNYIYYYYYYYYLLFMDSSSYWQDLGRIFEENGGVREKEPFFLSGAHDREVFSNLLVHICYWARNFSITLLKVVEFSCCFLFPCWIACLLCFCYDHTHRVRKGIERNLSSLFQRKKKEKQIVDIYFK